MLAWRNSGNHLPHIMWVITMLTSCCCCCCTCPQQVQPKCWQLPQVFNSEDYVLHVWHVQRFVQVQQKEESKKFSNGQHASLLPRPREGTKLETFVWNAEGKLVVRIYSDRRNMLCGCANVCVCGKMWKWFNFRSSHVKKGTGGGKLLAAFACVARVDFLSCSRLRLLLLPPPSLPAAAPF